MNMSIKGIVLPPGRSVTIPPASGMVAIGFSTRRARLRMRALSSRWMMKTRRTRQQAQKPGNGSMGNNARAITAISSIFGALSPKACPT